MGGLANDKNLSSVPAWLVNVFQPPHPQFVMQALCSRFRVSKTTLMTSLWHHQGYFFKLWKAPSEPQILYNRFHRLSSTPHDEHASRVNPSSAPLIIRQTIWIKTKDKQVIYQAEVHQVHSSVCFFLFAYLQRSIARVQPTKHQPSMQSSRPRIWASLLHILSVW